MGCKPYVKIVSGIRNFFRTEAFSLLEVTAQKNWLTYFAEKIRLPQAATSYR